MGDLTTADCKEMLENLVDGVEGKAWKRTRKWNEGKTGVVRSFNNIQNNTTALIVDEGNGNTHCLAYEPSRPSFCIDYASMNQAYSHLGFTIITNKKVSFSGFEEERNYKDDGYSDGVGIEYSVKDLKTAKATLLANGFIESPMLLVNYCAWPKYSALQAAKYWEVMDGKISMQSVAGLGWVYEKIDDDGDVMFFVLAARDVECDNDQGFPFDIQGFDECMECTLEADSNITNPEAELEKVGFVKSKKKMSFY
jgi:hypothetical protein